MYQKFFPKNVHNFTQVFVFLHQFGVVIGVVNLHASSSGLPACTTLNLQSMKIDNTIIDIITACRYSKGKGR